MESTCIRWGLRMAIGSCLPRHIEHGREEMNAWKYRLAAVLLLAGMLLAACQAARREEIVTLSYPGAREVSSGEVVETVAVQVEKPAPVQAYPGPQAPGAAATPQAAARLAAGRARLIVKDAQMRLLVLDTDVAIDRTTQMVTDLGGYIVSSRVWYQETGGENFKYATLTLGVPVDRFEQALRRLRELAVRVLDENATGQDVTDEYVDLESRLKNLQATRDRVRQFLEDARTVEEALKVNDQLASIEGEIEQVQGRMNYLFDRAAFSTITIDIEPEITALTPSPTATTTPTPTPTPWNAAVTFQEASKSLRDVSIVTAQAAIWFFVLIIPMLLPPALIIYVAWYLLRGRKKGQRQRAQETLEHPAHPGA